MLIKRRAKPEVVRMVPRPEVTTTPEERANGGPDAVSVIAAVHVPGATGHIGGTVAELIVFRLAAHGFKIVRN